MISLSYALVCGCSPQWVPMSTAPLCSQPHCMLGLPDGAFRNSDAQAAPRNGSSETLEVRPRLQCFESSSGYCHVHLRSRITDQLGEGGVGAEGWMPGLSCSGSRHPQPQFGRRFCDLKGQTCHSWKKYTGLTIMRLHT